MVLGEHNITAGTRALSTVDMARGAVILVAKEAGLGIVPDNALADSFAMPPTS